MLCSEQPAYRRINMARACIACNGAINETDTICPHCGADLSAQREPAINSSVNDLLNSMLDTASKRPAKVVSPEPEVTSPEGFQQVGISAEPKVVEETPPAPDSEMSGFTYHPDMDDSAIVAEEKPVEEPLEAAPIAQSVPAVEKKRKALENSFDAPPREAHGNKTSKLLVAVVVLAIFALLAAIIMLIIVPMQQNKREKAEIVTFLEGAWISDEFAFFDSTAKNFVEVLTVDKEGNFKMLYTIPDEEYPDGWNTGNWKIEEEVSGHIDYVAEEQRLLLLYEQDGENFFFDRTFILKEDDTICLREFYDESKSTFYDVTLHRIKMP